MRVLSRLVSQREGRVGHLNQQANISGAGVPAQVGPLVTAHNGKGVRFRLAIREDDGELRCAANASRTAEAKSSSFPAKLNGAIMGRIARHFQHHIVFEKLDLVLRC